MIAHADIAAAAYALEPLPATATRLAAVIAQPDWDLDQIVQVVRLDPTLSGQVLRFANSALSGAQREIATIDDAVMRIGPGMVLGLAMGAGVRSQMKESVDAYGIGAGELWRHAVCAALAADVARRYCRTPIPNEAFPAALLHDVGKQVLGRFLTAELLADLERARAHGCTPIQAEAEVLGVDHSEVGGLVAQHWKLPKIFVLGITHHHEPAGTPPGEDARIAYAVCLANLVARRIGYASGDTTRVDWRDWRDLLRALDTRPAKLERLCEAVEERVEEVLRAYS